MFTVLLVTAAVVATLVGPVAVLAVLGSFAAAGAVLDRRDRP